jgi:aminomethyltransferase
MLNPEGGVIDDLILYRLREGNYRMVVNAATADKDLRWLTQQGEALALPAALVPRTDLSIVAVQGPGARQKVWRAKPSLQAATEALAPFFAAERDGWLIARTGYTGEDGFEVMLPAEEAVAFWRALRDVRVVPAGLGARDTLRLEAGMNLYGQDMDEQVTPLESGLAWTVDLKSARDFIGKSALLRQPPRVRLTGLICLDRGVLRGGQKVSTPRGEGITTSGSFAPTLNVSIAFARVPYDVEEGTVVQVQVRDRSLNARTVKYPFVRHGKSLVSQSSA